MTEKNQGKQFETSWRESYKGLPIYYLRLADSAKWERSATARFQSENPYDSLQFKIPFLWLLELKSTKGSGVSFIPYKPYEKLATKKTVMIKPNQVKSLMDAATKDGIIAGFIINYRARETKTIKYPNEVFFVHITDFILFAGKNNKASLSREDCQSIGLKITGNLKKVNYTYDIKKFINDSVNYYLDKGYIDKNALKIAHDWIGKLLEKKEA